MSEHSAVAETAFPATSTAVPASRRFVTEALRRWSMPSLVDDAESVTSELVTNAVTASTSAGTAIAVRLKREQAHVVVEVTDAVQELPVLRRPTLVDPRGYGLALVASLSIRWGTRQQQDGKVIWSELATP